MNIKNCFFTLLLITSIAVIGYGQNKDRLKEIEKMTASEVEEGWNYSLGVGLNFLQFLQLNPQVGAGENRIQFGGVGSAHANYLKGRFSWNSSLSLLFGIQKLGVGSANTVAYQKTIDELYLSSIASYKTAENSHWAYTASFTFLSQLTPTYLGNYLSNVNGKYDSPISKFLSPAQITFAPGISWVPNNHLSVLISPIGIKTIIVADDDIASIPGSEELGTGLHGTSWTSPTEFENTLFQAGATLRVIYNNKYFNDKIIHTSDLTLFSNYLHNPQNIDINFRNQIAFQIWKGLQLALNVNLLYDDDIPVQITDYDSPTGVKLNADGTPVLGKRLNVVETFSIKYNLVF